MSLFTGNVVDKNETTIDCKFTLFHYNTNKISDIRSTQLTQWNVDSDDSDINNGGAAFASGDIAIIHLWTDTACAVVKVIGDGSDSYVFDVQLLECQAPNVTISVNDGTINNEIVASNSSSDEYQWNYKGITHYHKDSWYGKPACTMVGISNVEYSWDGGTTWEDSVHTYTEQGDQTVKVRITNKCGLTDEDSKVIKVKYNTPTGVITITPSPIILGDTVTALIEVTDIDSRVTNVQHYIDSKLMIEGPELTNTYDKLIDENKSYPYYSNVLWNDGYDDQVLKIPGTISLKNQPPVIDMESIVGGELKNEWTFISNAVDPENELSHVSVKVYLDTNKVFNPDKVNPTWAMIQSNNVDLDSDIIFHLNGTYKVTMQAFDVPGLSSTIEEYVVVIDTLGSSGCQLFSGNTIEKIVYVTIGGRVSGGIDVMNVAGDTERPSVTGVVEEVELNMDITEEVLASDIYLPNVQMDMEP